MSWEAKLGTELLVTEAALPCNVNPCLAFATAFAVIAGVAAGHDSDYSPVPGPAAYL